MWDKDPRPRELYRMYDADDRLLYVGIAVSIENRMVAHYSRGRFGSPWWPEVAWCSLERFPTETAALTAERHAIRTELPLHNKRSAVARA